MRRMILASLILLPVIGHAQSATGPQMSPSSAINEAELTQPALPAELALGAAAKASSSSPIAIGTSNHLVVREFIQTQTIASSTDQATFKHATLEHSFSSTEPVEGSAPKITKAVEVSLSTQDLAGQPAVSKVILHTTVDANGMPQNVAVTRSAGSVIDRAAIDAVSQFRFQPATLDNKPTSATVSIAIKIQKP